MPESDHRQEAALVADTRGPLATGDPWQPMANAIRSLPRSMFTEKTPQSLARALVAQAAYTTVRDPSASARLRFTAVTTLAKMLQSFDQTRSRPDALSSRASLAELDRSGTLSQVPLDVLLASLPSASQVAKRGGDAIGRADPH